MVNFEQPHSFTVPNRPRVENDLSDYERLCDEELAGADQSECEVEAPKTLTPHASLGARLRHDAAVRCQERGRIARELHDSTSQLLIALQLNLACLKASSENADTHQLFCSIDDIMRELHSAVRAVSSSDATPSLTDDLLAALRLMATRFALFTKIEVTLDVRGNYVSWPKDMEMS